MNQCVPIYWGSRGLPEPEVLNGNGIVFFNPVRPAGAVEQLQLLESSQDYYDEFISMRKTTEWAEEWIEERIDTLLKEMKS